MRDYTIFIPEYIAASWAVMVIAVELFLPKYQQADPFELAKEIKLKSEATFKQARV